MANTAQARKRARQAVKLNAHNSSQRSTLRTAIKSVRKAIDAGVPVIDLDHRSYRGQENYSQKQSSSPQEPSVCCSQSARLIA